LKIIHAESYQDCKVISKGRVKEQFMYADKRIIYRIVEEFVHERYTEFHSD